MKKSTTPAKENKTAKEKNIVKVNLSQFADRLKDVDVSKKTAKETIYVYPEMLSEAQINGEDGKKFRNKLRNAMKRFCNNIFVFAKTQNEESLKKEISAFDIFYKENYRVHTFEIGSISNTKNANKEKDLIFMLDIIKACQTNTPAPKIKIKKEKKAKVQA